MSINFQNGNCCRSGTSVITKGLQVLGVALGENLLPPVAGNNDKGFWEDMDINALNIEMLDFLGNQWHFLKPVQSADVNLLQKASYHLRASELLENKMSNVSAFAFKDPRTAKLLPFWKEVFKHSQYKIYYILAIRHPTSVAVSLKNRDGFNTEKSYLLWLEHVINSFSNTIGENLIVVGYDHLMKSPNTELSKIAKGLQLQINDEELKKFKSDFLDDNLRHSIYEFDDLACDETAPALLQEVYLKALEIADGKFRTKETVFIKNVNNWAREFLRLKPILIFVNNLESKLIERDQSAQTLSLQVDNKESILQALSSRISEKEESLSILSTQLIQKEELLINLSGQLTE